MKRINHKGFTLVELLVALALGIILLSIVVAIYLGSKATFNAATGVARSQEATRFAIHFLKRDVRLSGFTECSSGVSKRNLVDDTDDAFPPSLDNFIFGWEFNGTDLGDTYNLNYEKLGDIFTQAELDTARNNNSAAAGSWAGNYIQGEPGTATVLNLPNAIAALNPIQGSDILTMSISEPLDIRLAPTRNQRNLLQLNVVDINDLPTQSGIEPGTIVRVGDCAAIDTFQNEAGINDTFITPAGGATQPGNFLSRSVKWQKKWNDSASVYETTSSVYYVGTGSSGKPALFRYTTKCGLSAACGASSAELVEGVESMQVLYGEDISANGNPNNRDGVADIYRSADNVVDFRDVVAVKVGLVVRSPDVGREDPNFPDQVVLDRITINPPDDRFQRFVNNTTIRIHNRGL